MSKILLVDDDQDDLNFVAEALHQASYDGVVETVGNGQELISLLSESEHDAPELILLDLNMPLMDGFQVLRMIREHATLKHIPIVVLTASSRKEDEVRCYELGCTLFLKKPYTVDEYTDVVTQMLQIIKP